MFRRCLPLFALLVFVPAARAVDPIDSFPPAKHGKGELKYVNKTPVLVLRGTPAEMGDQYGVLAINNAQDIDGLHQRFIKDAGIEKRYPYTLAMARLLKPNFPQNHLLELQATA